MTFVAIEPNQRNAATVAGVFDLFTAATAIFAEFFVRARLIVPDDVALSARNIAASQSLLHFRALSDLLTVAGAVAIGRGSLRRA